MGSFFTLLGELVAGQPWLGVAAMLAVFGALLFGVLPEPPRTEGR